MGDCGFGSGAGRFVLAFDTANEAIAVGVGRLRAATERDSVPAGEGLPTVEVVATSEIAARRQSNTQLLARVDAVLAEAGVQRGDIACVAVGRGPGSFTGVRIAMATAKGVASALGVALVGVSSLDAVAWGAWHAGVRGSVLVAADAMRKEVYPVRYEVSEAGPSRLEADRVVKADAAAAELQDGAVGLSGRLQIAGDALTRYSELFELYGVLLPENLWAPTGRGLLLAFEAAWRAGEADPFDAARHNPAFALPVYTRLSDAEENERLKLAKSGEKNLVTGVQDRAGCGEFAHRATMHEAAVLRALPDEHDVTYKPLDASHAIGVAALEALVMGSDAWTESMVLDELPRRDRVWWAAYDGSDAVSPALLGYAGGWVVDGEVQILKVGVSPDARRRGIARELLARVAADARDLGAQKCSLEVRAGNRGAQAFYEALGLRAIGKRPHYYSDREDALIMEGPLPVAARDVAGMHLQIDAARQAEVPRGAERVKAGRGVGAGWTDACYEVFDDAGENAGASVGDAGADGEEAGGATGGCGLGSIDAPRPLILAIESSCDETAAAIVDGEGNLVSDVVASQIDFHARFGGVVPEIASRKHIEAICGVCAECLDVAAKHLGASSLAWGDLDAVACTYAPGLVGALVVGVAFAKGAAWAAELPFVGVNHLEGHLYANKIGAPDFAPPAVVSLVSGGNTLLVHMRDWGSYETLGATIDDAVGEAFDKVSKALGLGYPGGPVISREAAKGNPSAIAFPRAMLHSGDLRFSLSGLKTAVVTYINNERAAGRPLNVPDICASFQQAVVDVQVAKAKTALEQTGAPTFCLGGGVAANPVLREAYRALCDKMGVRLILPPLSACGDNAGMIALVALDRYRQGKFFPLDADAQAHANLDEPY